MTFKIIKQIASAPPPRSRIGGYDVDNVGAAHPLWVMLNARFRPVIEWHKLAGAVKGGITRIAAAMHAADIPYGVYVDWLDKFGKGYLKSRPLALVGTKTRKDGQAPVFAEFGAFINHLLEVYRRKPEVLQLVDQVYHMYPDAWAAGQLRYLYVVDLLERLLTTKTDKSILVELAKHAQLDDFLHAVGDVRREAPVVDLSAGRSNEQGLHVLMAEMKVRTGVIEGQANPALSRYFKTDGKLNAQGLKVVTGERSLKEQG